MEYQIPPCVRIYYPYFPLPAQEGSHVVVATQIEAFLTAGWNVELVHWLDDAPLANAEFFPFSVSTPRLSIRSLSQETAIEGPFRRLWRVFRSISSRFASPEILFYPPRIKKRAILDLKPVDLEIFNYSFAYPWLHKLRKPEGTRRVVVFHNQESTFFEERAASSRFFLERWIGLLNARKLRRHEADIQSIVDEVWWVSPKDQKQGAKLGFVHRYIPPTFPSKLAETRKRRFEAENHDIPVIGFVGRLDFHPNYESIMWFLKEVAPQLRERGFRGEVVVVGKAPPAELCRVAAQFPFVNIRGYVNDLEDFWARLSVMIVPQLSGSGVRVKIIESLTSQVPVLTHRSAVEALDTSLQQSTLLTHSDDAHFWAEYLMRMNGCELRRKLQTVALAPGLSTSTVFKFLSAANEKT